MLEALRRSTGGWIAKIFIGVLVLSFAVWGIADIFGGFGNRTVAQVGEVEISVQEFNQAYQTQYQNFNQRFGNRLTPADARNMQLDQQVLGRLIGEAILSNDGRTKGLGASDQSIAEQIKTSGDFNDGFGQFSKESFDYFLLNTGLSEADYVRIERDSEIREQLTDSLILGASIPNSLLEAANIYQNEKRNVEFITLSNESVPEIAQPSDTELEAYFKDNQRRYDAPEYRKLEVIELRPEDIASTIDVPEEVIVQAYEAQKNSFIASETRDIQQIVFDSEEEAKMAREAIDSGKSFLDIAKEKGLTEEDISLNGVAKADLFDKAVADAAFSMAEAEISQPLAGTLGTVMVRVGTINKASVKPLEEVRDQIRQEEAIRLAQESVLDLFDEIEDDRAAGSTFEEISEKRALPLRVIEFIDRQGLDDKGISVADLPNSREVINSAFETDPGVEADAIQLSNNGYLWFNTVETFDQRERNLDEVRDKVLKDYIDDKKNDALGIQATKLIDEIKAGKTLAEVAEELNLEIETASELQRNQAHDRLSNAAIASAFSTSKDSHGSSSHKDGVSKVVFKVVETKVDPLNKESQEAQAISNVLDQAFLADLVVAYIASKQQDIEITQNQRAIDIVTGAATDQGHAGQSY